MADKIKESELILNDRGGVYHLDLRPEELATTIITVGDPDRVPKVSQYFDEITHQGVHREFVTHTGRIGEKELTVVSTGIGPDNIDIVFNELDALVNIDLDTREVKPELTSLNIVRLGTCGGLQPDIPTDGLVATSHAIGLDNLMHYYRFRQTKEEKEVVGQFKKHVGLDQIGVEPYFVPGSKKLLQAFAEPSFYQGVTATCPGFYGPQGRTLRVPIAIPDLPNRLASFRYKDYRITNFEMETSAIFGLGKLMGHECLAINTVIANRSTREFTKDSATSVEHMIEKSLEVLAEL